MVIDAGDVTDDHGQDNRHDYDGDKEEEEEHKDEQKEMTNKTPKMIKL